MCVSLCALLSVSMRVVVVECCRRVVVIVAACLVVRVDACAFFGYSRCVHVCIVEWFPCDVYVCDDM